MTAKSLPAHVHQEEMKCGMVYREAKGSGDYVLAEKMLLSVWNAYPDPKHLWDSSQSLIKDIADFYRERRDYAVAEQWAGELFKCDLLPYDAEPYIILGRIYLDSDRQDLAAQYLIKAYELGGRRGYVGEEPKYLKFALDQMKR
ncbi:hypothetical protein [Paracidovorax valerianellae]|uniref:Tetratricopeptide repeat-containing protein n=1 Tax=Paracidovorax valerianellae TaxID=187868 RepID=A0A1G6L6M3_9BURK|nr:hypothetical protein [Paracidovorax valerianellae]MDA8446482.1 hypothetical protein [Paracidovorax valerianellae]SDC38821.1 hypothetical protein SAMN05192589_10280 [Paracidovorax valerianellae]